MRKTFLVMSRLIDLFVDILPIDELEMCIRDRYLYIWAPHMEEIPSMRNADSILPIFRTRVILM